MNILLVSQCSGHALTETRRILDQFAERRGDCTWQTPITQQGLDTLRQLLKKTARKNTAVACHWIRGHDRSELIWIVGDARRFNVMGAVPTNTTTRDVLRAQDENPWHTAEDIKLLARMAALWHDVGKANKAFQDKLKNTARPQADAYRHEWVSLRLFAAYVGPAQDDTDWLQRLADNEIAPDCLQRLVCDDQVNHHSASSPLNSLPRLAQAVGWLVLTHHRLPINPAGGGINKNLLSELPLSISADWAGSRPDATAEEKPRCWDFPEGLPTASQSWCAQVAQCAQQMLARSGLLATDWIADPYAMHTARMVLMLADHYYSGLPADTRLGEANFPLYANTDGHVLKQRLDEHLIGVARYSRKIAGALLRLDAKLPRIARHKGFRRRAGSERFRWQDKAHDLAQTLVDRSREQGFFGVNMASTGCGKTLANGRIMAALSDPLLGTRFSIALGLRTLTLQTGEAYRRHLQLGPDDLAVLVGDAAVRELFADKAAAESRQAAMGSESAQGLLPDNSYVHYESSLPDDDPFSIWLKKGDAAKLLYAPVLTCTIDHLMPACESTRGGHQIAPMLRLMSSDLVLDEPDDFGMEDLPALSRLVFWAGLLGSRVLLSSATLPPALVEGLFEAYRAGREVYGRHHGHNTGAGVCCAWFDEWHSTTCDHALATSYQSAHAAFVDKRLKKLDQAESRRHGVIKPLTVNARKGDAMADQLAASLLPMMQELHASNHEPAAGGQRISMGLLRMANIDPIIDLAKALYRAGAPTGLRIHLCVYHSRYPLLQRSGMEARLDRLLDRSEEGALLRQPEIIKALARHPEQDQLWLVLASPVAEVGRDHDYDWAIVEPSSMRSIIQLAGRVRRHRPQPHAAANIFLLDTNVLSLKQRVGQVTFTRPGFETTDYLLRSHQLSALLTPEQWQQITAAPRIRARPELDARGNLADLEHQCLQDLMLEGRGRVISAPLFWRTGAHLTGVFQQRFRFRQGREQELYALVPDEDGRLRLRRYDHSLGWQNQNCTLELLPAFTGEGISPWGEPDYEEALSTLAAEKSLEPEYAARRFGKIMLPAEVQGWVYHPWLGFQRKLRG